MKLLLWIDTLTHKAHNYRYPFDFETGFLDDNYPLYFRALSCTYSITADAWASCLWNIV